MVCQYWECTLSCYYILQSYLCSASSHRLKVLRLPVIARGSLIGIRSCLLLLEMPMPCSPLGRIAVQLALIFPCIHPLHFAIAPICLQPTLYLYSIAPRIQQGSRVRCAYRRSMSYFGELMIEDPSFRLASMFLIHFDLLDT